MQGVNYQLLAKMLYESSQKLTCVSFRNAIAKQHKQIIHESTHHNFILDSCTIYYFKLKTLYQSEKRKNCLIITALSHSASRTTPK